MSVPLFSASGLQLRLGGTRVLFDVGLSVAAGEIVTIVGPNGSGKTSLLRIIVGALVPDAGSIRRAPGLVIGYVPQRLAIDHTLPITVGRFLELAMADEAWLSHTAHRVGIEALGDRQLAALSGGQFQRVLLAQALLRRPALLVLDEASQGLDQPAVAQFYHLIEEIRTELGCGVLMVSHDLHVVMSASDRVICLNGHVCCEGTPTVVSAAPEYRALFGLGTEGALALYRHHHDHTHAGSGSGHLHQEHGAEN